MATRISTAADEAGQIAACSAAVGLLGAGAGPGYIEVRTGTQPASVGTAATGTLLVTVPVADPAFGAPAMSGGVATATAGGIETATAVASGTAGWWRAYDSDGVALVDGSATGEGDGGDLELNDPGIIQGGTVTITSWIYTQGRTAS